MSSVVEFRLGDRETSSVAQQFPAITLDSYVEKGAEGPTLMKIDVEGFELEVLRGAHSALTKYHPRLWVEVHPKYLSAQNKSAEDVLKLLRELKYELSFFSDHDSPSSADSYHVWCS